MAGNKTRDGLRVSFVERQVTKLFQGVTSREGSNHPINLEAIGMRPCPLGTSTDVRRMIIPWLKAGIQEGSITYNGICPEKTDGNRLYNLIKYD